jgi:CheY-like chemotaxis protein
VAERSLRPIVFVTAYNDPHTIERIHEQVPDAPVVSKPEHRKGLADAVRQVTEHRSTGDL